MNVTSKGAVGVALPIFPAVTLLERSPLRSSRVESHVLAALSLDLLSFIGQRVKR